MPCENSGWNIPDFEGKTGIRQGCVLSPILFNCFMDKILEEVAEPLGGGLQVEYTTAGGLFLTYHDQTKASKLVQDILYAYELQHMLDVLDGACSRWGMTINVEKTKVLTVRDPPEPADQTPITLQNCTLEDVTSFSYLQ